MNHLRTFLVAAALLSLAACQPKPAGEAAPDTTPAIATVNGSPISRGFYEFYIKGITGKTSADLTAQQRAAALDNLIRGKLTGEQAIKEGLDKSGDTSYLLNLTRLHVLEQAVSDKYLKDRQPTDDELHKEYDAQIGAMPKLEYHARNIVVSTEGFAQSVIGELEKGAKFEDVAKDVDVVLDSVGKDTLARSYGVVKKGGFIVSIVRDPDRAELEKHGIHGASISVEPNSSELDDIGKLIDEKKIKVIVSQTFPLFEAAKAQEQVATGHTRGKIVLKVADEPK